MNAVKSFLKGVWKGIGFKFVKPEKRSAGEAGELIGESVVKLIKSIFNLLGKFISEIRARNKKKREEYSLNGEKPTKRLLILNEERR